MLLPLTAAAGGLWQGQANKHFQMISFCVKNRTQDMQEEVEPEHEKLTNLQPFFPFAPYALGCSF